MTSKHFQGEVLPYISPQCFLLQSVLFSKSASQSELGVRRPLNLPPASCVDFE